MVFLVLSVVWASITDPDIDHHSCLRKQPTLRDATTGFPAKWRLGNDCRNSILMTCHCPDLGSASDWLKPISPRPIWSFTQIWRVTRHHYGIFALVSPTSFREETSGDVAKFRLFSQATTSRKWSNRELKAWFSLAHKHKHKDVRTPRMAYLTKFSIPALLNPMINKMVDEVSAILLLICSHEVWVKVTYDWSTALCLCLCVCRPSFHQSKLRHKHNHKHKNELVPIYCAYAYVDPVFTCLHKYLCLCLYLCASEKQA